MKKHRKLLANIRTALSEAEKNPDRVTRGQEEWRMGYHDGLQTAGVIVENIAEASQFMERDAKPAISPRWTPEQRICLMMQAYDYAREGYWHDHWETKGGVIPGGLERWLHSELLAMLLSDAQSR